MVAQRCSARKWSQDANSGLLTIQHLAQPRGKARWEGHGILSDEKEVTRQRDAGRVFPGEGRAWCLWECMEGARNSVRKRGRAERPRRRQGLDCEGAVHLVGKSPHYLAMGSHEGFQRKGKGSFFSF